jgi:hypothetical protein
VSLRIGDAEEAARRATVNENSKIALSMLVVKWVSRAWVSRAVDSCAFEVCVRGVKAASRAQRGRSNAERLDRADANLTIGVDGPATARVSSDSSALRSLTH